MSHHSSTSTKAHEKLYQQARMSANRKMKSDMRNPSSDERWIEMGNVSIQTWYSVRDLSCFGKIRKCGLL
jgi:hypothetical protein